MSEITRAYAVYKGQQYNASYNSGTQLWKVDIPSGADRPTDKTIIHIQSNSMPLTQRATRRSCTPPTGHMEIS